jgi:bla regulator protein blaR1
MIGVLLLSARLAGGWMGVRKLKRGASLAGAELEDIVKGLKRRLRVSAPVRLCTSATVRVPTAIGWLRPYILLPVTALTGLSEAQIAAILAHELAHISRRDYLLNSLQTAIETVLFYHPAVWWVGRQMRLEREHCCDDMAVAVCGSAFEYASALAEMEQIRDRIPEPALAATGGDLLGRIRRVLGRDDRTSRSLGGIAAAALVLSMASATAIVSLYAAPQDAQPAFEVASIKRDVSDERGGMFTVVPVCHLERMTLKHLVTFAWRVNDFQVTEGPGWIDSDRYNIDAKAEGPPSSNQEYVTLQYRRLQTLLRDRFNLTIHSETKELPVYELTVAKRGPKLQTPDWLQREPGDFTIAPGKYCELIGGSMASGRLQASSTTMANLGRFLSSMLSRTVVDKTGITGEIDLQLTFTPDRPTVPSPDAAGLHPADGAAAADPRPDFFTALQEQLGLKLESTKGPVETLVIDLERPDAN